MLHSLLDATQESKQGHLHVDAGCCHSTAAVGCPSCHPGLPVYNVASGCHSSCTSGGLFRSFGLELKSRACEERIPERDFPGGAEI